MKKNKLYFNKDADLEIIKDKVVGIIGFGNQGRAQALNLIDSKVKVIVGIRKKSKSIKKLKKLKIKYDTIAQVVQKSDVLSLLVPDKNMTSIYNKEIHPYLRKGQTLLFSHGYNIHYKLIIPPKNINVVMVAPSGGGNIVRDTYKIGQGVPTLIAIHNDYSGDSLDIVKSYSKAIGGTRICAFMSTFKEETETDLYGEQVILTGGLPAYINKSLKVLLEPGYDPVVAWFVCYYELKTIVDLFHEEGFNFLYNSISDTAKYGGMKSGQYLIDDKIEYKMKKIITDIKSGKFADDLKNNDIPEYKNELSEVNNIKIKELFKTVFKQNK